MLRITAGEHRGRRLKVPDVTATRPLVERAREGLYPAQTLNAAFAIYFAERVIVWEGWVFYVFDPTHDFHKLGSMLGPI